jgi:hypothetical protein
MKSRTNEMGWASGTDGGRGEIHYWFWWANLKEGYDLEDLRIDERIILK